MPRNVIILIACFSLVKLAIHFAANSNYGIHADELYYIALSHHLQWGYLDNSPLIAFLAAFSRLCFGESAFAYRILPTIFSVSTIALTGLITYHLGGKRLAIVIACMAMLCSPAYLATAYFLQPVAFEQFFWVAGAYCMLRYIQTQKFLFLYTCAVIAGLGILNKYTICLYTAAIIAGVLLSKARVVINGKNLLLPVLLCLLIILPNLVWQVQHHFPVVKYVAIVKRQSSYAGTGDYLFQFFFMHGPGLAVWLAGLAFLLLSRKEKDKQFMAWAFLLTSFVLFLLQGKIYYGLGAFPALFAAGGVCWEKMLEPTGIFWRYVFMIVLVLPVPVFLPTVVPILPFPATLQYFKLMRTYTSITEPLRWDDGRTHPISQFYADMLGWQELAQKTDQAYRLLDSAQSKHTVILTESYPVAGAISYYRVCRQVPVISSDNSFILWSPAVLKAEDIIYISRETSAQVAKLAKEIKMVGEVQNKFARERGTRIYLLYQPSSLLKKMYNAQRNRFYSAAAAH